MTLASTWQDVLKENLVGRVIATSEMGISFRGTIDRVETSGDFLYIYPKAWFRLWPEGWVLWETDKTKELGYAEPVIVRISGEDVATHRVYDATGEIFFYVPFKGQYSIRYHDCVVQCSDDPGYLSKDWCASSDLVYLKDESAWVIRTKVVFADHRRDNLTIDLYVLYCTACGEKLPKF